MVWELRGSPPGRTDRPGCERGRFCSRLCFPSFPAQEEAPGNSHSALGIPTRPLKSPWKRGVWTLNLVCAGLSGITKIRIPKISIILVGKDLPDHQIQPFTPALSCPPQASPSLGPSGNHFFRSSPKKEPLKRSFRVCLVSQPGLWGSRSGILGLCLSPWIRVCFPGEAFPAWLMQPHLTCSSGWHQAKSSKKIKQKKKENPKQQL